MKDYSTFIFESYDFDAPNNEVRLRYSLDDEIFFTEILEIPRGNRNKDNIENTLFLLHLAAGVSYYKTCCPKNIEIRSGSLNEEQAQFWNTVYENGLGEFFYRNNVDFRGLINFPVNGGTAAPKERPSSGRVLVPIGGGKDSVVTVEKLKSQGRDMALLRMGTHPLIDNMVSVMNLHCMNIKRKLPRKLFEMNEQGAMNGHVPITAFLSCLCVFIAEMFNFDEIAMSNEKSANEGNTEYLGKDINHQWSKSAEFETAFADYVRTYINPKLQYHSLLRDMTELEIVEEYVKHPQYFDCTTSCNANWRIAGKPSEKKWCGICPKCTFVFALMAAYMKKDAVVSMFGDNLFENENNIPLYKQLLGKEGFKPFECVGTPEETKQAFTKIWERKEFTETPVMKMYIEE